MKKEDEIISEVAKIQLLYEEVLSDTEEIKALRKKLLSLKAKTDTLNNFYQNEWLEYREILKNNQDNYFSILGEDPIYESIYDQYVEVKKLLKECSEYIQEF